MPSSTDRKARKTRGANPMMNFLSKALATAAVVIAASSGNVPASHPLRGRPRRSNPRAGVGRGAPGMPRAERNPRRRWQDSMFWTYISSPTIANPEDYDGRYFQKRFRVPYPVFENIVDDTKASDWWKEMHGSGRDAAGREAPPCELYVAASLSHLGTGHDFAHLEWHTGISKSRLLHFHHRFTEFWGQSQFERWVHPPDPDDYDAISLAQFPYNLLGFPGAIGSVDGVHIGWERASEGTRSWFVGKEGVPTLQFNCSVGRNGRFMSVSGPVPGATNDLTAVRFDKFVNDVHEGRGGYGTFQWQYFDHDGVSRTESGVYLLCDAGYHRWRCLQCPIKATCSIATGGWSKHLESVRKDVECAFGRLKGRFRCLRIPCLFHKQEDVANQFRTCVVFENMIIAASGSNEIVRAWEKSIDWSETSVSNFDASDEYDLEQMVHVNSLLKVWHREASDDVRSLDVSHVGTKAPYWRLAPTRGRECEIDQGWFGLRTKLVAHWQHCYDNKLSAWVPSRGSGK